MLNFCIITSLLSAGVQLFKNNMANAAIKRKGYNISSDNRSKSEILSSFIKDYFYILVPGVNIYKAFKLFMKDDNSYALERKSKLEKYERLNHDEKDTKDTTIKKESIKDVFKKGFNEGVQKVVDNRQPIKIRKNIKPKENKSCPKDDISKLIDTINDCNDINYLLNLKNIYREKATKLRIEYKNKQNSMSENEKRLIIQRVKIYDNVFINCRDRLRQLRQLKSENIKSL